MFWLAPGAEARTPRQHGHPAPCWCCEEPEATHDLIALCRGHSLDHSADPRVGCMLTAFLPPPGLTAGTVFSFHSYLSKSFLPKARRFLRRRLLTRGKCRYNHQTLRWGGPHLEGRRKGICPDFHVVFSRGELKPNNPCCSLPSASHGPS